MNDHEEAREVQPKAIPSRRACPVPRACTQPGRGKRSARQLAAALSGLLLSVGSPPSALAQADAAASGLVGRDTLGAIWTESILPGSTRDQQLRWGSLGAVPSDRPAYSLIRAPSHFQGFRAVPWVVPGGIRVTPVAPALRSIWNSDLAYSQNHGYLWAGRGWSSAVDAGVAIQSGPVQAVLAPTWVHSANRDFQTRGASIHLRHPLASPWFTGIHPRGSIDLAQRQGLEPYSSVEWGQSSLSVEAGPVTVGVATENQWWGPGVRNALVLSSNASGLPHAFVRTTRPLTTGIGTWEAKWMLGRLERSPYYFLPGVPEEPGEGNRSLSGMVATYQPVWTPSLTLGLARTVWQAAPTWGDVAGDALAAFLVWDRRAAPEDVGWQPARDQLTSFFFRAVFPTEGLDVYGEWARYELPTSVQDLLVSPDHSQGYTLGLRWTRALGGGDFRLGGEVTYVEQSATMKHRPVRTFYTGIGIPEGYTHRGRVLGAAIGPGSSSQWASLEQAWERGWIGAALGRIRWETDGLYTSPPPRADLGRRTYHSYDASVLVGIHGGVRLLGTEWELALLGQDRFNYLFQNPDVSFTTPGRVDVRNYTGTITVRPSLPRR